MAALRMIAMVTLCLLALLLTAIGVVRAADRVVLQLPWYHQFQFAGYYMAVDQGYYRDAGLEVIIRDIDQGDDPLSSLLSKQADFGVSGSGLLIERSLGQPVVVLSAILQSSPTIFLSLNPSIRTPADLKGRRIMMSPGYHSASLLALLHQENLGSNYTRLDTSYDYASLIKGETDVFNAYSTNEPFQLQQQGYDYQIIDPHDYGINFYGDVLFTTESKIAQNAAQVEAFRKASLQGWEYALEHVEETIEVIRNQYAVRKSVDALRFEAQKLSRIVRPQADSRIGDVDVARWAQIAHHLIAIGAIKPNFHLDDAFFYSSPRKADWRHYKEWIVGGGLVVVGLLIFVIVLARTNRRLLLIRQLLEDEVIERERAETQLARAKQTLQDALTAVSDGVWTWDIKTGNVTLDRQSKKIFGLDETAELKTSGQVFAYVAAEDVPGVKADLEAHIAGETVYYDHEFRVNRPDGTVCWVRGRGRVLDHDDDGNPVRIVGTNADITARKRAEQSSRENEERFRDLIEQVSGIAIQGYDEERRVTFWNRASEKLYGYSQQETVGQRLEDLIIPADMRDEVIRLHRRWIEEGIGIPSSELNLVGKDNQVVPVYSSHVMRRTSSGCEMFCIDVNLAPLKDAERRRQELEDQLYQVHKMEALGTLAGGIAHDFNNILAIILGNVELSQFRLPQDSEISDNLRQAKVAILRARDLVQQILVYTRQGPQELKVVNLTRIIDESLRLLRATIPSTVEVQSDLMMDNELSVRADSTQLQQVLINLCNNAVHALGDYGTIEITLKSVVLKAQDIPRGKYILPGEFACLTVCDSGYGIEPAALERIFDPFFTTKRVGEGTGMGLAVVQGIIDSHAGFVTVESLPEQGATFHVYLPLCTAVEESSDLPNDQLPTGTETVLFVDDEDLLVDLGSQILKQHGYRVVTRTDSLGALEIFEKDPEAFDLVITDQTMPVMDGVELVTRLRDVRADIPIIMCTGYSAKVSEENAEELGIDAFCMKPVNTAELLQKTRKVLDGDHLSGQSP